MTVRREECDHAQITAQGRCLKCGLQFRLKWSANRWGIAAAVRRNIGLALVLAALLLVASRSFGSSFLQAAAAGTFVFFTSRVTFNLMELFSPHAFFQGPLKDLHRHSPYNILAPFRWFMVVGRAKFPIHASVYGQFQPGDAVLVEFLRWTKVPVAIYKAE